MLAVAVSLPKKLMGGHSHGPQDQMPPKKGWLQQHTRAIVSWVGGITTLTNQRWMHIEQEVGGVQGEGMPCDGMVCRSVTCEQKRATAVAVAVAVALWWVAMQYGGAWGVVGQCGPVQCGSVWGGAQRGGVVWFGLVYFSAEQ